MPASDWASEIHHYEIHDDLGEIVVKEVITKLTVDYQRETQPP